MKHDDTKECIEGLRIRSFYKQLDLLCEFSEDELSRVLRKFFPKVKVFLEWVPDSGNTDLSPYTLYDYRVYACDGVVVSRFWPYPARALAEALINVMDWTA